MAACFSDKNHFKARNVLLPYVYLVSCPDPLPFGHFKGSAEKGLGTRLMSLLIVWLQACTYVYGYTFTFRVRYLLSDTRSSQPLNESAQTWHEFVYNTDNSKSDYSKTRRITSSFFLSRGLKTSNLYIIIGQNSSINGRGALLRLRQSNIVMTDVFKRGTIPYHTH